MGAPATSVPIVGGRNWASRARRIAGRALRPGAGHGRGPIPRDPVRWALSKVLITVLDINDFRPQFSKSQFSTSVYENEPSGTSVITMTATDLDEGDNGVVTYSIEGPGAGRSRWWGAPTHGQGSCRVAVRGQATLSVPGGWLASRLCMLSQEQPLSVLLHHSQFLVA